MIDHRARALDVNDATYAAWNAHDPDAVAAVFAEDAVIHDAGSDDVEIGRDAVRERAGRLFAAFPDLTLTRVDLVIDGPRHADRWVLAGSHEGGLFGAPAASSRLRPPVASENTPPGAAGSPGGVHPFCRRAITS